MPALPARQSQARTPEALHAIIEDAYNRGDLDAYAEAYDDAAAVIAPPEGRALHGRDQIRAAAAPLFALRLRMTMVIDTKLETDGIALTHGRWTLAVTDAGGNCTELIGCGTTVSRRTPDGTWRIVLDNALSPA